MAARQLSEFMRDLRRVLDRQDSGGITDSELVKRYVQQRDETAFEALLRRHGPMVFGVCRRVLHNQHDAEDAFQATFLILVRKASSLGSPGMIGNWLYGVAYRTALHAREAAGKRRAKEAELPAKSRNAKDVWADLRPALDLELERLPDKYRSVIVLCDLEGKTRKEAARHLGRTEGTVASRLARGRVLLAKRLARHGLTVSGGALAAVLSQNASASVPASPVSSTIKAATLLAAGKVTAGVISAKVAALTEGVLKAMLLSKLKIAMVVMLLTVMISGVGAAVGFLMPGVQVKGPAEIKREQPAKPAMPSRFLKGDFRIAELDWSPDGKTLATVTVDVVSDDEKQTQKRQKIKRTAVRLWDVQSGSVKRTLADDEPKKHTWTQAGVALSPDGKIVAAATTAKFEEAPAFCGWVILWDPDRGKVSSD